MSKINKMKNLELSSDEGDTDNQSDSDICGSDEIATTFSTVCKLITEKSTTTNKEYILHIDATKETDSTIAVGTNESCIGIYSLSGDKLAKLETITSDDGPCIGVKFSRDNSNLLYTGYNNGIIKIWDLRTPKQEVNKFTDKTTETVSDNKVFTCFDTSCNSRVLAAGTEVYKGDAYILFWDTRNVKLLGGYWESHTDDVTQLKFHPDDKDKLISSSTDGLINIYDLSEACEDDALLDSLNTESSVEQLKWIKRNGDDGVFCATHTFDVQLWGLDDAEPFADFKRAELGASIKRKSEDYSYVANAHLTKTNELFLLVGSNYKDGECLRSLSIQKDQLKPRCAFTGNKQRVRSSFFNERTNTLITGGEKGILNIWTIEMS